MGLGFEEKSKKQPKDVIWGAFCIICMAWSPQETKTPPPINAKKFFHWICTNHRDDPFGLQKPEIRKNPMPVIWDFIRGLFRSDISPYYSANANL